MRTTTIAPTHSGRDEVNEIVEAMSAELDQLARVLADTIHERIAELDDDLRVWTLQSVRANLGLIVTLLREGTAPSSAQAPPEALAYAKEYVRRGLPFEFLGRAYRIGQASLSRYWLEHLHTRTDDPDDLVGTFGFLSDWLFGWVETLEHQLTEFYMREREQSVRGAAAVRAAEVRALLEGARVDVQETSKRLAYNLDRHHVAFIVWSDEADRDAGDGAAVRFGEMEHLAARVAESLGAHAPLIVPQGHHLACWTGFHEPPVLAGLPQAEDVGARAAGRARRPSPGLDGFCVSHREARQARRVAQARRARRRAVHRLRRRRARRPDDPGHRRGAALRDARARTARRGRRGRPAPDRHAARVPRRGLELRAGVAPARRPREHGRLSRAPCRGAARPPRRGASARAARRAAARPAARPRGDRPGGLSGGFGGDQRPAAARACSTSSPSSVEPRSRRTAELAWATL